MACNRKQRLHTVFPALAALASCWLNACGSIPLAGTPQTASPQTPAYPSYAYPPPSPTLDATDEAIIAAKATLLAEDELTQAAAPTVTPLPTFPVNASLCRAANLTSEVRAGGATGSIVLVMSLVNISDSVCILQGPPAIAFFDTQGKPLQIRPVAENDSGGKLGIGPGERAIVAMTWFDWDRFKSDGNIAVRLTLSDNSGYLENAADIPVCSQCDPGYEAAISIGGFLRSP